MLTKMQQFLIDTYGYVIIPDLVETELLDRVRKAMDRMNEELPTIPHGEPHPDGKPRKSAGTSDFSKFGPCIEYDPSFIEIAMHPKVMACAEDIVGGPVRYEEQESSINSRHPETTEIDVHKLGWHRGISPDFSRYEAEGKAHYLWIKAIVFLTDIGPDDGGTSVIPGSHRFGAQADIVPNIEPWMVHQAQGKAGSVLLFSEALIHTVTPILSDRTRYIMITGYVPHFMREYNQTCSHSSEFLDTLSDQQRAFIAGEAPNRYGFRLK